MYNEPELQLSEREHRWSRSNDKHITAETIREDESYSRVDKRTGETVHGHRIRTCYNMRDCESEKGSMVTKILTWTGVTLAALATGALTYALTQSNEEEDQNEHHENQ
ncbi:hypothetical protein KP509_11G053900 [Ceratopteris richardii]|nr:hypothetical protein KP509_11G053900 [Ceratopteris richardii]